MDQTHEAVMMAPPRLMSGAGDHSAKDWEKQRERFTQLYVTEDKTLRESMEIMERLYGFNATERQFKRRITKWNLDKNIKDSDMKFVLGKQLKRKLEDGKESAFEINGRPVPLQKMQRFVQRKGYSDGTILATKISTPVHITYHTPCAIHDDEDLPSNGSTGAEDSSLPSRTSNDDRCRSSENSASAETSTNLAMGASEDSLNDSPSIPTNSLPYFPKSNPVSSYMEAENMLLQVPTSKLATQITCLLWFEPWIKIQQAEKWAGSSNMEALAENSNPTATFHRWTSIILATTKVTQNLICLALLFIYRLKEMNPMVLGKSGSEYQLLVVALMLSNKFLDDYQYTNKTWAGLTGISVYEINQMEVEFLSNMRFSLVVTDEAWKQWQARLVLFLQYFANAPNHLLAQAIPSIRLSSPGGSTPSFSTPQNLSNPQPKLPEVVVQDAFTTKRPLPVSNVKTIYNFTALPPLYGKVSSPFSTVLTNQTPTTVAAFYKGLAASPYERWSQRYDLSSSPNWFRRYVGPRNPLSLSSPCPIGTPWNENQNIALVMPSLGINPGITRSPTAHRLEPHQMHYRNLGSSKDDVQSGFVPQVSQQATAGDWDWSRDLMLSDENSMYF